MLLTRAIQLSLGWGTHADHFFSKFPNMSLRHSLMKLPTYWGEILYNSWYYYLSSLYILTLNLWEIESITQIRVYDKFLYDRLYSADMLNSVDTSDGYSSFFRDTTSRAWEPIKFCPQPPHDLLTGLSFTCRDRGEAGCAADDWPGLGGVAG